MKHYLLKETPDRSFAKPEKLLRGKAPSPHPSRPAEVIKLGGDVGLRKYAYCRQVDGSRPEPPQMTTPEGFREVLLGQQLRARRVVVCYEAGLFGFELARWVMAQGMECVGMAPVKLDEGNKRVETDKLNARDIESRLDRYLAGNPRVLTACRIPTRDEELARQATRQRQQLADHRKALEAQGRSLLWEFGYLTEGQGCWWKEPLWERVTQRVEAAVRGRLERLRTVILELQRQLEGLERQLGGFIGRKSDGEPGTQTTWLGLQRLDDLSALYRVLTARPRPPPTVFSSQEYR